MPGAKMNHAHNQSVVVVGGKVSMGSIESLVGGQKSKVGGGATAAAHGGASH